MVTSMVVLVVYAIYVLPYTSERYAPVAAHRHGPRTFSGATELVEIQAGQVHIARAGGGVQTAEDEAEAVGMLCLNPRLGSGSEEPLDSFVSKPLDRHACKCNLHGYRAQPAGRRVACIAPRHHLNRVAPASALAKKTVSAFLVPNPGQVDPRVLSEWRVYPANHDARARLTQIQSTH
jgi:hypothetical protein